jgi:hypothetical protein
MTPAEAAAAARELAHWLDRLAVLDSRPTSNAELIYTARGEAADIIEALAGHLVVAA